MVEKANAYISSPDLHFGVIFLKEKIKRKKIARRGDLNHLNND
jgi:hypothetical protein